MKRTIFIFLSIIVVTAAFAKSSLAYPIVATCHSEPPLINLCVSTIGTNKNYLVSWSEIAGDDTCKSPNNVHVRQFLGEEVIQDDSKAYEFKQKSALFGIFFVDKTLFTLDRQSLSATLKGRNSSLGISLRRSHGGPAGPIEVAGRFKYEFEKCKINSIDLQ